MSFEVARSRHGVTIIVFGRLRVRSVGVGKEAARSAKAMAARLNASEDATAFAKLIEPILDQEVRLWRLAAGALFSDASDSNRAAARLWEIAREDAP